MRILKLFLFSSLLAVGFVAIARYFIIEEEKEAAKNPPKEQTCDADAISQEDYDSINISGEILEKQANQLVNQKKYTLAIRKYNEAIAAYHKESGLQREEGAGNYDSIAALKEGYPKVMEKSAQMLVQVGRAYTQLQKHENAADCFSIAIRFRIDKPNDAIAYLNRADAYQRLGERVRALEDFTTASDLFKQYKLPAYQKIADDRIKGLMSSTPAKSK